MSELTINDYKQILDFYKKPIPNSKRRIKINAEKILVSKLCRCIKKVEKIDKKNEKRAIGICSRSVLNSKGLVRGRFTCKKKQTIRLKKQKNITKKNRNNYIEL